MLTVTEIEQRLKAIKPYLVQHFFVDKIGYFGSFVRNEQNEKSDVDILVNFKKPIGWEFFDLKEYLENQLNIKVDLISEKALKEQLRERILNSVKYV